MQLWLAYLHFSEQTLFSKLPFPIFLSISFLGVITVVVTSSAGNISVQLLSEVRCCGWKKERRLFTD